MLSIGENDFELGEDAKLKKLEAHQRNLEHKIEDLEIELDEFKLVLNVTAKVEATRPCHRLVGDVFVPHSASGVHKAVESEKQKVIHLLENYREQLHHLRQEHANLSRDLQNTLSHREGDHRKTTDTCST